MSELPDAPFTTDLPNAPFVQPDMTKVARHFAQARTAKTFGEYLDAGWQQSVTGLVASGKAPEVALDAETPWYGRLAAGAAGLAGDAPAMLAGGLATTVVTGGRGGPIAAGAGAFAAPMAIRAGLMDAYTKGEVNNASEFLSRVMNVAWEGFKGGVTGAATVATGGAAKALTAAAPMAAQVLVPTAAEIVTMTTVGKALEGNLPEWSDFLDASVLIFGVKGAVSGAGKLATIYEKNGRLPAQVVVDARTDPQVVLDLKPIQSPATHEPMVTVYHGSPHTFEEFSTDKIGKGEGAQAYGHGLYFAENPKVAREYNQLRPGSKPNIELSTGESFSYESPVAKALLGSPYMGGTVSEARAGFAKLAEEFKNSSTGQAMADALKALEGLPVDATINSGALYKVQIPHRVVDTMLDWDKPLSEQSEGVKKILKAAGYDTSSNDITGADIIKVKGGGATSDEVTSDLQAKGIAGVRYLDQGSRAEGKGTSNFVLFDAKNARVIQRNGETIGSKTDTESIPRAYKPEAEAEMLKAALPITAKAQVMVDTPFSKIPQEPGTPKVELNVNYDYINHPEDIGPVLARASEIYGEKIIEQTRGKVSWQQTESEQAVKLAGLVGAGDASLVSPRLPGEGANAVELGIRTALMEGAAADFANKARDYDPLTATAEQKVAVLASAERVAMLSANFQGAASEVGRAMQYLKNAKRGSMQAEQIKTLLDSYGKDPDMLAQMAKQIDTPEGMAKFARDSVKATIWEKILEAWKAGLLSGPVTQMRNVLGNTSFLATRPVIDATASAIGFLRGSPADRVTAMEPVARIIGNLQGTIDGAKYAWSVMKTGEDIGKSEQYKTVIGGKVGEVIRLPFRALSAADAFFKTMNERGEAYSLAVRQATQEGLNPTSREFQTKVVELVENPTKEMSAAIEKAGLRFTFNMPLGEKGQALQGLVRKAHLEWAMPFVRTPGNILKETVRLTPFSPLVGEWRAAIKEGGAARDKAIAELATGTAFMGGIFMAAAAGNISGAGDPDPGKRRVAQAAGWQPYSIKVGDTWYNYQGIGPVTTLIGLSADMAMVWDRLDDDESDKIPKILAVAFANAVTSQTALMGMTSIVNVTSDPTRYAPRFFQGLVGTVVPAIVAQPTAMADPYVREVNSMLDAIKARIPGEREQLLAKRDLFGEQIKTKERLGGVSPITTTTESDDKVRTEAERLGLSASAAPKKVHIGRNTGKVGDVKLTPEQQDKFDEVSGALAKHYLDPIVNAPSWDAKPDIIKKRLYAKVFLQAHKAGANAALPPDVRGAAVQEITARMQEELRPE